MNKSIEIIYTNKSNRSKSLEFLKPIRKRSKDPNNLNDYLFDKEMYFARGLRKYDLFHFLIENECMFFNHIQRYLKHQTGSKRILRGKGYSIQHHGTKFSEQVNTKILFLKKKLNKIILENERNDQSQFKNNMYRLRLNSIDDFKEIWLDGLFYVDVNDDNMETFEFELEDEYFKYSLKAPCFIHCEATLDNKLDLIVKKFFESLIASYYIREKPELFFVNESVPKNSRIPIYFVLGCGGFFKDTINNIKTFSEDILNKISEHLLYSSYTCRVKNPNVLLAEVSNRKPLLLGENLANLSSIFNNKQVKIIPYQKFLDRYYFKGQDLTKND